jgi:hypothetical protein
MGLSGTKIPGQLLVTLFLSMKKRLMRQTVLSQILWCSIWQIKTLSPEAVAVLDAGRDLWRAYFAETDVRAVRDEYKLNRADVGWYQVRKALQARNASGDFVPVDFKKFETAYQWLTEKLQPKVFELGFLR